MTVTEKATAKRKKMAVVLCLTAAFAAVAVGIWLLFLRGNSADRTADGYPVPPATLQGIETGETAVHFRAAQRYFYLAEDGEWRFVYLKGVNIGLTEATTDLASPDVSYETYAEWLTQIAAMNANTVKVFTVMPPQFYEAFADHNESAASPLYLIQGIWFDENLMYDYDHAFDGDEVIISALARASRETVDIIHGSSDYTDYGSIIGAVYDRDISRYVAGYVLGLEWETGFVGRTNEQSDKSGFAGKYLKTSENASPFETFLCRAGETLIAYETENYASQTPVAFLNWQTTDTLTHTNEPFDEEDAVCVDTENILPTEEYYPGLFAAIDVYPYYPEFMNCQPEYTEADSEGNVNPYSAYLTELAAQYTVPVLIAEFGLPTSRGIAHESVAGMDQGGLTEREQGEYNAQMLRDIARAGCAGSMLFSWQDEWFKQTWNTVRYAPSDPSRRTPDVQSAEQSYGILAMEPGETTVCTLDGDDFEWMGIYSAASGGGAAVSALWDEGYLYLKISGGGFDFDSDTLFVPIRISGNGSYSAEDYNLHFGSAVDFLLQIKGKNETRLLCDDYEDVYLFRYGAEDQETLRDSGKYNPVMQFTSNEFVLPLTGETVAARAYESGLLRYGTTDPESADYYSQADIYEKDGIIELRIPWGLLNVANSTEGVCYNNFRGEGEILFENFSGVYLGIGRAGDRISLSSINYRTKETSSFHTRLKKSYAIIADAMANLMQYPRPS